MSDTGTNTRVKAPDTNERVQDSPLTIREHLDPDKHWIGETLAPPTQGEIEATIGLAAGPGESPFVARADHKHKIDSGLLPTAHAAIGVAGTTSSTTALAVCTLNIAARPIAGNILIWAHTRIQKTVSSDIFQVRVTRDGVTHISNPQTYQASVYEWVEQSGWTAIAANTACSFQTVVTRLSGTGTASAIASSIDNKITALYVPTFA